MPMVVHRLSEVLSFKVAASTCIALLSSSIWRFVSFHILDLKIDLGLEMGR